MGLIPKDLGVLREFEELSRRRREVLSPEPLLSTSYYHRKIIFMNLIEAAKQRMRMLAPGFDIAVFAERDVAPHLKRFLASGGRFQLLIARDNSLPLEALPSPLQQELGTDHIEVRVLAPDLADEIQLEFLTADDSGYRFAQDRSKSTSIASFNDPTVAGRLNAFFDELWARSAYFGTKK